MPSSSRPRTPSGGVAPPQDKLPPIPESKTNSGVRQEPRRSSFGLLLRRSKSGEQVATKISKKQQAQAREQELLRQQLIPKSPPKLPVLYGGAAPMQIQSFGGDDRSDSGDTASNRTANGRNPTNSAQSGNTMGNGAMPPANGVRKSDQVDPYARTESMTHRGRYSYASSAISSINSPRRVRRRKDPTPFNILVIGAQNSGKTSFLEFLKTSLALPPKKRSAMRPSDLPEDLFAPTASTSGTFNSHYLETEIDNERIGITLWDSEGLDKSIVDLQLRNMASFLESKFEETFTEEMKVIRAPGVQDTHIHCVFLLLDPARLDKNVASVQAHKSNGQNGTNGKYTSSPRLIGGLDEDLDLQVLRILQGKTTVVPVISKADTITTAHMRHLKKMVWDSLRQANLDPLEALGLDDESSDIARDSSKIDEGDEEEDSDQAGSKDSRGSQNPEVTSNVASKRLSTGSIRIQKRQHMTENAVTSDEIPYLPLSIISPDIYEPGIIGRKFPWGFADPYNGEHCDFLRLKEAVFSEWRGELREASRELWYEGWRTSRLKHRDLKGSR